MKRRVKIKVGDEGRFTILDHCIPASLSHQTDLHFHVYGRVVRIKGDFITVACWDNVDGELDVNSEGFEIVASAVKAFRRFR